MHFVILLTLLIWSLSVNVILSEVNPPNQYFILSFCLEISDIIHKIFWWAPLPLIIYLTLYSNIIWMKIECKLIRQSVVVSIHHTYTIRFILYNLHLLSPNFWSLHGLQVRNVCMSHIVRYSSHISNCYVTLQTNLCNTDLKDDLMPHVMESIGITHIIEITILLTCIACVIRLIFSETKHVYNNTECNIKLKIKTTFIATDRWFDSCNGLAWLIT